MANERPPPPRLFPRTEAQAKVVALLLAAAFVAAVGYLLLRGLGVTQLFGE